MNLKDGRVLFCVTLHSDESFAQVAESEALTEFFHDEPVIVDDVLYTDDTDHDGKEFHSITIYLETDGEKPVAPNDIAALCMNAVEFAAESLEEETK